MSKKGKIIIFSIGLVIVAGLVVFQLKKARGDELEVQTTLVERGNITQLVSGSGKIQPEKEVKISAFVSAEITRLPVREGDPVRAGQLLTELDRTRYEAAHERAKSNVKAAQANLKKAKSDLKRAQDLFERKLSSTADLESAEANFELMESQVEQQQANLKQAEDDLSKTRLISPIEGTVAKLNKEEGEIALGSQFQADVIMAVADLTKMEMVAEIDENDVVLVSLGDTAKIEVDALPDRIFFGIVSEIAHTATTRGLGTQEEVTNFEVTVAIRDNVSALRPGMSATVDIETETHHDAVYVPIQAITMREPTDSTRVGEFSKKTWRGKRGATKDENDVMFGPDRSNGVSENTLEQSDAPKMVQVVFAVEDGKAIMIPVDTGISSERNVEILSDLPEGSEIVTGSFRVLTKQLKDDSRVKVKKERDRSERKTT